MNFVPLTHERFANKHWQGYRDSRHLKNQHWIAIAAPEVTHTAAHLPLVFMKTDKGEFQLGALMGLTANHNDCLDESNKWLLDYTPALLRVHPFKVLPTKEGSTERVLCVAENSPWIDNQFREPLFDQQKQLAPRVKEVLSFLMELEKHLYLTQRAVDKLAELNLLSPYDIKNANGQRLEGIYQIDEERLQKLPDDQLPVLRQCGALALAYAQLISTGQMAALQRRALSNAMDTPSEVDLDKVFDGEDDTLHFNF